MGAGLVFSDVALIVRIYLRERIGWEIFVAVFREALLGRVPWLESGARNRTGDAVVEILFSCSDNAKSCLMISAFCDLVAFLGRSANTFTIVAHITSAVATPINGMLIIYSAFLGINGQPSRL
jgi:hypothetical protein